jgi:hypothetical protein
MQRFILTIALPTICILGLSAPLCPAQDTGKKEPSAEALMAQKKVEEHLAGLKAEGARVAVIADTPELAKLFPKYQFVAVHFAEWPVPLMPPEPLKARNIFAVLPDGKIENLTQVKDLEGLYKRVVEIKGTTPPEDALGVWFRLSQELQQDGYFKFKFDKDSVKVTERGDTADFIGDLKVVEEMGNKGSLQATITFNLKSGKVSKVEEKGSVMAGVRPRCQATRLLDPDPVIRAICEQDLLVMGRAIHDYLKEQRAQAGPELQRAIDRVWQRIIEENR